MRCSLFENSFGFRANAPVIKFLSISTSKISRTSLSRSCDANHCFSALIERSGVNKRSRHYGGDGKLHPIGLHDDHCFERRLSEGCR